MSMTASRRRSPALVLALLAVALFGCDSRSDIPTAPSLGVVETNGRGTQAFDVYVQNMYLGGDTGPLFSLDFNDLPAVIAAASTFWGDVQQSGIPDRVAAMVDEIEARQPHVVGLQEVLRFVELDEAFQPVGGIDLLAAIESEIAGRGLPYQTEVVQDATSSVLPISFDPNVGITGYLSFTDRVVVLRRSDVSVSSSDSGKYESAVPLGPVTLERGWARVSVDHEGVPHHFVTTHLEVQALAPVQAGQANELVNTVLAGLEGVTILGGDLNSDAAGAPGDPSWTPTYDLLRSAGFADVWDRAPHAESDPGYTCCQDNDLQNMGSTLSQRIDFVLARSSEGEVDEQAPGRGFFRAELVGEESGDRTASGLWPSDHAGMAAGVRLLLD